MGTCCHLVHSPSPFAILLSWIHLYSLTRHTSVLTLPYPGTCFLWARVVILGSRNRIEDNSLGEWYCFENSNVLASQPVSPQRKKYTRRCEKAGPALHTNRRPEEASAC